MYCRASVLRQSICNVLIIIAFCQLQQHACHAAANSITAAVGRHADVALFIEFASKFGHQRSLRFLNELTMTGKPSAFQSVSAEGDHYMQFNCRATSLLITVSCQALFYYHLLLSFETHQCIPRELFHVGTYEYIILVVPLLNGIHQCYNSLIYNISLHHF